MLLNRRFYLAVVAVLATTILVQTSCKKTEDDDPVSPGDFDRKALLANMADGYILPHYQEFQGKVNDLDVAVDAFVADRSLANLTALRASWEEALLSWQSVGMLEFGPAESQALRGSINIYPVDTAQILDNITTGSYNLGTAANLDAKGFQALDYLLFGIGADDVETILLYDAGSSGNLRTYLQDVMDDIKTKVDATVTEWEPSGGNYIATFKDNDGTDVGSSIGLFLNAYVMHYEVYFRDGQIGIPAGARSFTQTPLPDKVEAYYHGESSVEFAKAQRQAYHDLYMGRGVDGFNRTGFDDYLAFLDAQHSSGSLNTAIQTEFGLIEDRFNALSDPYKDEVVNNQQPCLDAFDQMQQLVVLLKVDMMSSLGVLITYVDNDGD